MVTKLTLPSKENAVQEKVNEIIDNLGGGYSAGTGIDISNNTISVDNTVAMKTDIPAPVTETTVSGWGFTKNVGTVTSVNNTNPDANGNVSLTIPTVNNATLTIQKNSTDVATFTANASSNVTANISVPTKVSDLNNDSGFISGITSGDVTSALGYTPVNPTSLATVATSGSYSDLTNKPTIPTVDQTYDGTSTNAQSGVAVASAISSKQDLATYDSTNERLVL